MNRCGHHAVNIVPWDLLQSKSNTTIFATEGSVQSREHNLPLRMLSDLDNWDAKETL